MAKSSGAWNDSGNYVPARPKKSRQGRSQNTIISATSRMGRVKDIEVKVDNEPSYLQR